MPRPTFDRLAPLYRWLERLSYGGLLQWCRTTLIGDLTNAKNVLILGDGDGRFLEAFRTANPLARITSLDISPAMVALAKRRNADDRVTFVVADAREASFEPAAFDLIVTNFFLDCFPTSDLEPLIAKLASALAPGGRWLVGDFRLPNAGLPRALARAALAGMYLFFRVVTRIPASRLVDPDPLLHRHGLRVEKSAARMRCFLSSTIWASSENPLTPARGRGY